MSFLFLTYLANGSSASDGSITLRLLLCEDGVDSPNAYLMSKDRKSDAFELSSSSFTKPIKIPDRVIALKDSETHDSLAEIELPDQGASFVVFLAFKENNRFTPKIIRMDGDSFKPGDYFFINSTSETLVLNLGDTEIVIEPGLFTKARPGGSVDSGFYKIAMGTRSDDELKIFATTRWLSANPNRGYIIFTTRPNGKITYRAIDE